MQKCTCIITVCGRARARCFVVLVLTDLQRGLSLTLSASQRRTYAHTGTHRGTHRHTRTPSRSRATSDREKKVTEQTKANKPDGTALNHHVLHPPLSSGRGVKAHATMNGSVTAKRTRIMLDSCACGKGKGMSEIFLACMKPLCPSASSWKMRLTMGGWTPSSLL